MTKHLQGLFLNGLIAQCLKIVNTGDEVTVLSPCQSNVAYPLLESISSHFFCFSSTDMVAQEALSIVVANL